MPKRVIEAGRLEVKGAVVRFKEKGTLAASDRNLAALETVRVRTTPAPALRLFADFVFPEEVFRVWQDATLVNFRDFLETVAPAGPENFRATLAHLTRALPAERTDLATREFVEGKPAERFANRQELSDYDRGYSPPRFATTGDKESRTEEAWKQFASEIAREKAETEHSKASGRSMATLLACLGMLLFLFSLSVFLLARTKATAADERAHDQLLKLMPVTSTGMLLGLGVAVAGLLYLRKTQVSDRG